MKKALSEEKKAKIHIREQKELARLKKEGSKPMNLSYFVMLIVVLTIVYIVDEITSNMNGAMQTDIIFDLFKITSRDVNSQEYSLAIDQLAVMSAVGMGLMFITPFYKSLSDRFGRRLFLMLNTLGMGIGLLIVMLSSNVWVYVFGAIFVQFFTPNDVQVIYIMECAPKKHRAKLCSITKAIALVSVSLIGVMKSSFIKAEDPSSWRLVYLIPAVVGILVGLCCVFFVRETPVFIDERSKWLSLTEEERIVKAEADKKAAASEKGGVINAIKFIFKHKQLKWTVIAGFLFFATTQYTSYYQTILTDGLESEALVNTALVFYPFFNGIITFFSGFVSDKLGRKSMCLIFGSLAFVCLIGFVLTSYYSGNPYIAGAFYGASIGGLWSMSDTLCLTIPGESSPTENRASVMGTASLLIGIGSVLGMVSIVVLQNFFPMGWVCLAVCAPFMLASLIILSIKVHETKDLDLDTVTGCEFD